MKRRGNKKIKSVEPITVWDALNQPVAEISEDVAKGIFMLTAVILFMIWVAPYWGQDSDVSSTTLQRTTYNLTTGQVAGAQTLADIPETPEWYYVAESLPSAVAGAFAEATGEVLDISGPASKIAEFYEPGTQAVWNGWLELMADPY